MLNFLNVFYTVLHLIIIILNVFGWIPVKMRRIHLYLVFMTLAAWLLIGWMVGTIGYCPLTDWHWDVKRELGETDLPASFIKYFVDYALGIDSNPLLIDIITALGLIFGLSMAIYFNFIKRKSTSSRLF